MICMIKTCLLARLYKIMYVLNWIKKIKFDLFVPLKSMKWNNIGGGINWNR